MEKNCFMLWKEIVLQEKEEQKRKEKLKEDLREEYQNVNFIILIKFFHNFLSSIFYLLTKLEKSRQTL